MKEFGNAYSHDIYTSPIKIDEDGVEFPKPVREWTNDELDAFGYNAK